MELMNAFITVSLMCAILFGLLPAYDWQIKRGAAKLTRDLRSKKFSPDKAVGLYKMACFFESVELSHRKHWHVFESEMFNKRGFNPYQVQFKHLYYFIDNIEKSPSIMRQLPV